MKTKILFLLVGLTSLNIYGQKTFVTKMDSFLNEIEKHDKGMGSLSIFKNGEEVYQMAIGFASLKDSIKSNEKTKYRIGSISKTYTATIIMQLIEEKKLKLNTSLGDYFPKIKNSKSITIEHLLRHRSGIFNFTNSKDFATYMTTPITKEELVNKIIKLESVFEPGSKAEYSNSNFVLLSLIAEKIDGKEFFDIIQERICIPCSLTETYFGTKVRIAENEANSFFKTTDWLYASESDMSWPLGAGAIVTSPTELNKFLNCLLKNKVLKKESVTAMLEFKDGFGLGLISAPFYDKKGYGHNGRIDEFRSSAYHFIAEDVTVTYISNGTVYPANDILIGALSIYFEKEFSIPDFTKKAKLSEKELAQYEGIYASEGFPLKIKVFQLNGNLMAQATGQGAFPIVALGDHKFEFTNAGIKMIFTPLENKMNFSQGGGKYNFIKE